MSDSAVTGVDPHADLHQTAQRKSARRRTPDHHPWRILAAVSTGGILGALARYGLTESFPHQPGSFGWSTLAVNVSGCLLAGSLMVLTGELWPGRRLLSPFLGVGLLGGYTTYSAYVLDIQQAVAAGDARTALLYLAATTLGALAAVWVGATISGRAVRAVRHRPRRRDKERRVTT